MGDLSDERIDELIHWTSDDSYGGMPDTHSALIELKRRRSAQAASADRVRSVVRDAAMAVIDTAHSSPSVLETISAIADRVAEQLSLPPPTVFDCDDQVTNPAPLETMAEVQESGERVAVSERIGKCQSLGDLKAADADRVRSVVRDAVKLFGVSQHDGWFIQQDRNHGALECIADRVAEQLGPVGLSAEERTTLQQMRESRYLSAAEAALLDRLLAGAPPAPSTHCRHCHEEIIDDVCACQP